MPPTENVTPEMPVTPDARKRQELLPGSQPESIEDDPAAHERVAAILRSPNYRIAHEDSDFFNREDARSVRLQMDFLKAELLLADQGIQDTIVVFGSTRIPEPAAARRQVEMLRNEIETNGERDELIRRLAIAERILAKSRYYDIAREFGRIVGLESKQKLCCHDVIMTGGGPGIMEAANRGTFDVGAKSVGLNISLPHEQYPNPYISTDLCFRFHYFALRKLHLVRRAKALIAFPGGYGTLDELFEVLTLIQTRKINPIPVVLIGQQFWERVVDFDFMVDEGLIDREDRSLFWFAETAQDIWNGIKQWHVSNQTPLKFPE